MRLISRCRSLQFVQLKICDTIFQIHDPEFFGSHIDNGSRTWMIDVSEENTGDRQRNT